MPNLAKRTGQVLSSIQFTRDQAIDLLAEKSGIKSYNFRYEVGRLLELGIIKPGFLFNYYRLGVRQYQFFLSLRFANQSQKKSLINSMEKSQSIAWYAQVSGCQQLACSVCAINSHQAMRGIDTLLPKGVETISKAFASVSSVRFYQKSYLYNSSTARNSIHFTHQNETTTLTEHERNLLQLLTSYPELSLPDLARKSGIPRTTIRDRKAKLIDKGIIAAEIYRISANALGFHTYRLRLCLRRQSPALHEAIEKYCLESKHIVLLLTLIGEWDYEMTLEVAYPDQALGLSDQLAELLHTELVSIELLQVFNQSQPRSFSWGLAELVE